MTSSSPSERTELMTLLAAVSGSPIVLAVPAARHFAEWCELQKPADVDGVILAWIASHVPARDPTTLS